SVFSPTSHRSLPPPLARQSFITLLLKLLLNVVAAYSQQPFSFPGNLNWPLAIRHHGLNFNTVRSGVHFVRSIRMRSRLSSVSLPLFCLFLISSSVAAWAQYRAGLQGAIQDPQGSVVSGATVTLTNRETNQARTTQSNDQ